MPQLSPKNGNFVFTRNGNRMPLPRESRGRNCNRGSDYTTFIRRQRAMTVLLPLFFALPLMACANNRTRVVIVPPPMPHNLLTCSDLPIVPAGGLTQRTAAEIMLALAESWQDCRSKLEAIRLIVVHAEQGQ